MAEQGRLWVRCGSGERVRGQGRGRRTRCGWSVPPGGPVRLRELVGAEEKDGVRAVDTRTKPRPGGPRVRAHGAWTNPPLTCLLCVGGTCVLGVLLTQGHGHHRCERGPRPGLLGFCSLRSRDAEEEGSPVPPGDEEGVSSIFQKKSQLSMTLRSGETVLGSRDPWALTASQPPPPFPRERWAQRRQRLGDGIPETQAGDPGLARSPGPFICSAATCRSQKC